MFWNIDVNPGKHYSGQIFMECYQCREVFVGKNDFIIFNNLSTFQNLTARRSPNSYMITNTRGKVGRFCLFKSAYKLGEDIVGTFDFSVGNVTCMQVI